MKKLFVILFLSAITVSLRAQNFYRMGSDIDGEAAGDLFGASVSLDSDGDRVAIGARDNDGTGADAGHVRVYEYSSSSWCQLGSDIDGESGVDSSGFSVSFDSDGDRVAIGAYGNDGTANNAGHVRVMAATTTWWVDSKNGNDNNDDKFNIRSGIESQSLISNPSDLILSLILFTSIAVRIVAIEESKSTSTSLTPIERIPFSMVSVQ